jgi:hypothetical protein
VGEFYQLTNSQVLMKGISYLDFHIRKLSDVTSAGKFSVDIRSLSSRPNTKGNSMPPRRRRYCT